MGEHSAPRSQRQLRVGEEIRHALAAIFLTESFYDPGISLMSITVSEVRISPDLRNATVFVLPLGGKAPDGFIPMLEKATPQIRHFLAKKIHLKFLPQLYFKMDKSYEYAQNIDDLLGGNNEYK